MGGWSGCRTHQGVATVKTKLSRRLSFTGKLVPICFALLAGCAAQVPTIKAQIVKVPVPVQVPCPAPALPPKPALITPAGTPSQIIKALVADLALVMGDDDQVRALAGTPGR